MRYLKTLLVAAPLLMTATVADAAVFVGSYNITSNTSEPGLIMNWAPNVGPAISLDLQQGISQKINGLFDIWTPETKLDSDDLIAQSISITFNFAQPAPFIAPVFGTVTGTLKTAGPNTQQYVTLQWDGPAVIEFGAGTLIIDVEDGLHLNRGMNELSPGQREGDDIDVRFTYVPEPATALLLGGGMVLLGWMRRRRNAVA